MSAQLAPVTMPFGKYSGKSMMWIIDNDLDYFEWMYLEGVFIFQNVYLKPAKAKGLKLRFNENID